MTMSMRIKEERLKHGLTQDQLATLLGIQKSAIAKYENGRVENIKRSTISKMASIFGCDPCYLLAFDEADDIPDTLTDKIARLDVIDQSKLDSYIDGLLSQDKYTAQKRFLDA